MKTNVNNQTSGMLTIREASQILNVHSNTLRRWTDQGIVKVYRLGRRGDRRFKSEDLAQLLISNETSPIHEDIRISGDVFTTH
jgi:excisionase family DNA binding protein